MKYDVTNVIVWTVILVGCFLNLVLSFCGVLYLISTYL
jgi:hypothetical protein